tara:strand:- start:1036 stop:1971 length:936 start_codon:yes stop_codon:yes gene_type:complete
MIKQCTIKNKVKTTGVGLHCGTKVELTLKPAPINSGIVFRRIDLNPYIELVAKEFNVGDTRMASVLEKDGIKVSTVEHLLSACSGMGIDNLIIELNAEEIPIMDGSASSFVFLLQQAGRIKQKAAKTFNRIKRSVEVKIEHNNSKKWARLDPYDGFELEFFIEFNHPAVDGSGQNFSIDLSNDSYINCISRARTFGFMQDVENLRGMGLARGGSLENAIVMDEFRVLNAGGLRYKNEFVRHKVLDAIGDLYLVGNPLLAKYSGYKSGHDLNNKLLRKLMSDKSNYELITFENPSHAPKVYSSQHDQEWFDN